MRPRPGARAPGARPNLGVAGRPGTGPGLRQDGFVGHAQLQRLRAAAAVAERETAKLRTRWPRSTRATDAKSPRWRSTSRCMRRNCRPAAVVPARRAAASIAAVKLPSLGHKNAVLQRLREAGVDLSAFSPRQQPLFGHWARQRGPPTRRPWRQRPPPRGRARSAGHKPPRSSARVGRAAFHRCRIGWPAGYRRLSPDSLPSRPSRVRPDISRSSRLRIPLNKMGSHLIDVMDKITTFTTQSQRHMAISTHHRQAHPQ